MTRRLLLAAAALAIVLAGCGDDDDTPADAAGASGQDGTAAEETTTTSGDEADGAGDAGGPAVTIAEFAFDPGTIEVAAGTTVTWRNDDSVGHTVTAGTPDAAEDTFEEAVDAGAEATVTFEEAGTFVYFCAIHPTMTGEVVVS